LSSITLYPTTNAVGTTGFTNPGNAYSSDNSYATAAPGTLNTISSYFGGFDFASYIPSGATINSVTVYCERKFSTTASTASSTLRPYNLTTALAAENENTSEPTTDTTYNVNFGALATADVRSADFRILVGAKKGSGATGYTYSLDMVCVTVDYTSGAYSLTCDYGSFAVNGQVANLLRAERITCDQASFALSGQVAALLLTKKVTCYAGYFSINSQDVTLVYNHITGHTLLCDYELLIVSGQLISLHHAHTIACTNATCSVDGQDITLTYNPATSHTLVCDYASLAISGQTVSLLRARIIVCTNATYSIGGQAATLTVMRWLEATYGYYNVSGQLANLTTTSTENYTLIADQGSFAVNTQSIAFLFGYNLVCTYHTINLRGQTIQFFIDLWEPTGDMITLGTLLTRIQSALGDPSGLIWDRTTVIWPFACDAIRDFPILRPKSTAYTVAEDGHSFALPADFRKLIYVEFPPYQDPPEYLQRKGHLGPTFFGEDGFCDLDRDYDSGGDYMLWVSNNLVVGDIVIVRYLATHVTEFANEYSYITIENQYVQVIINHVILMAYTERLALQLQDPTAHTSTIQQMSDAVKTAESNYLDLLKRAQEELTSSQRLAGWKVDKHDRIY
jgi:hypothetical protein